jgi:hypothetical protein
MTVYLNTYLVHQAYGGPEEGGWWYECGEPVNSFLVTTEDYESWSNIDGMDLNEDEKDAIWNERAKQREAINDVFKKGREATPIKNGTGGYTFVLQGSSTSLSSDDEDETPSGYYCENDYVTYFQEDFAEYYPKERPHYC